MGSRKDDNINSIQDHFNALVTDGADISGHGGTGMPDIAPGYSGSPARGEGGTDSNRQTVSQGDQPKPHRNTNSGEEAESPGHRGTIVTDLHPVGCNLVNLGHAESDQSDLPSVNPSAQENTTKTDPCLSQSDIYNHHPPSVSSHKGNSPEHGEHSIQEERRGREKEKTETEVRKVREEKEEKEKEREPEKQHMPSQGSGAGAFPFPASSDNAVLHGGRQVEFCSVATAPMTPKMPDNHRIPAAFPELNRREVEQRKEERKERKEERKEEDRESPTLPKTDPGTVTAGLMSQKCSAPTQEVAGGIKNQSNISHVSPANSEPQTDRPCQNHAAEQEPKPAADKPRLQQGQKADTFDQEITILVTHHYSYGAQEEGEKDERGEMRCTLDSTRPKGLKNSKERMKNIVAEGSVDIEEGWKVVPPVPQNSLDDGKSDDQAQPEITGTIIKPSSERNQQDDSLPSFGKDYQTDTKLITSPNICFSVGKPDNTEQHSLVDRSGTVQPNQTEQLQRSLVGDPVLSSPARQLQHMQTQGDGTNAFHFPASSGRLRVKTKDAELQVGQQVECRSVATAPMTPKMPNNIIVPVSFPERIGREGEKGKEEILKVKEPTQEEESDEPVQEVRWDERGMTWEVYGAVVEVAVLGSAIQKHLEKQVKKLRRQPSPSLPPPPPLNPAAVPLRSSPPPTARPVQEKRKELDSKKDRRRRRNPFRPLLKNVQQPICCSRTNSTE
ncbi:hypothetical protein DPEC_G00025860 [Dallia pectoralis]|uniref:Uncharacterized protein n=1 Tax=Dallia pectoralis TaxID=75939 RepID=A0ACC2HIV5_DALPE|nr:hypothetical protein DPEC_G00025860 [Dallia pectoralis]